ncbi:hypothetical protein [Bordetella avium]|uniref:hypothetical protein n=1 Tax=Bordetella avium TaxID=521 RepID=UPI000E69236F|nr:hypothetical protein [Bordetella avium]AZY48832.1 hypothetical protein C0J09_06530 [Bordetella avium]RIQ51028.1 hypothetical protein D0843_11085 [Bordetella avium]
MAYKAVTVEISLDEFDDEEIIGEAEIRGLVGDTLGARLGAQRQEMLRALWNHDDAKAVELLKTYLCDCLGRATI